MKRKGNRTSHENGMEQKQVFNAYTYNYTQMYNTYKTIYKASANFKTKQQLRR